MKKRYSRFDSLISILGILIISTCFYLPLKKNDVTPTVGRCIPFTTLQIFSEQNLVFDDDLIYERFNSLYDLNMTREQSDSIKIHIDQGFDFCVFKEIIQCNISDNHVVKDKLINMLIKMIDYPLDISDDLDGISQCASYEDMAYVLGYGRSEVYINHYEAFNSIRSQYINHFIPKLRLETEEIISMLIPVLLPAIVVIFRVFLKGS